MTSTSSSTITSSSCARSAKPREIDGNLWMSTGGAVCARYSRNDRDSIRIARFRRSTRCSGVSMASSLPERPDLRDLRRQDVEREAERDHRGEVRADDQLAEGRHADLGERALGAVL